MSVYIIRTGNEVLDITEGKKYIESIPEDPIAAERTPLRGKKDGPEL